ncbi:calcium homeostasis modulator protein 4 [Bufo gargarizans]|uniref:calcium homeostasis modulator protein 4 n=1 Tax=Bufo gargarizans TaxID=30331 RepID=UPI001CF36BF5|nr:calcium homeostasis modulator protein 4 [Bufo gargarizans]
MSLTSLIAFLKNKESIIFNAIVALLTVGGQQLFSFFAFSCPCSPTDNLRYGLAFLGVPALILLIVGFVFNDNTWRLFTGSTYDFSIQERSRQSLLLKYKLICFVLGSITGRALVAPVTWLAVTLLNGSYYSCAASEFANVDHYDILKNMSPDARKFTLAQFPCAQLVSSNLSRVREEVLLELKYQSQLSGWLLIAFVAVIFFITLCVARCCSPLTYLHLRYWTSYVNNEQNLFDQAADQHSKVFAMENIKRFFGFSPGSKNISEIRIPSRMDWKTISGLDLLKVINQDYCHYSLLHAWSDEEPMDGKVISIDVGQVPVNATPQALSS